jgi:hypothetical protein
MLPGKQRSLLRSYAMNRLHFALVAFPFFSIFFIAGCALKMGHPVSDIYKLHLRVKNDSLAPVLGPKLDREIRKSIVKDGSFHLVNNLTDADASLIVQISQYGDSTEAYRPGDTLLAAGFNLRAIAKIELLDEKGRTVFAQNVSGNSSVLRPASTHVRSVSTHVPDEAMAMQALAESLAAEVCLSLLNQAW